jgi:hypothetical protein
MAPLLYYMDCNSPLSVVIKRQIKTSPWIISHVMHHRFDVPAMFEFMKLNIPDPTIGHQFVNCGLII